MITERLIIFCVGRGRGNIFNENFDLKMYWFDIFKIWFNFEHWTIQYPQSSLVEIHRRHFAPTWFLSFPYLIDISFLNFPIPGGGGNTNDELYTTGISWMSKNYDDQSLIEIPDNVIMTIFCKWPLSLNIKTRSYESPKWQDILGSLSIAYIKGLSYLCLKNSNSS